MKILGQPCEFQVCLALPLADSLRDCAQGNAVLDDVPDSDHNGKAEHKGSYDSAHPRVRYWRPDASTLLAKAQARQKEYGDVPEWVWGIAKKTAALAKGGEARL